MMNFNSVKIAISSAAGRGGLLLSKHSPEILVGVGVVGMVVSTVMACKATLKAEEVIERANTKLDQIKAAKALTDDGIKHGVYTDQDYKKDLAVAYVQTGVDFAMLYGPSIALGLASIGCIVSGHNILHKRNLAVMAAYTALDKTFKDYRKRVADEFGENRERMIRTGAHYEVSTTVKEDADGNKIEEKNVVEVVNPNDVSQYAKWFDSSCSQWDEDPHYCYAFLKAQQNYANDLLHQRGHIFLNEVYDMLGIPRTTAGQMVGWVKGVGDDFVDFGIYDVKVQGYSDDYINDTIAEQRRDFVNGYTNKILLDFNVAGVIHSMI